MTSCSLASPLSRVTSACFWQPFSIFPAKCRGNEWSPVLLPASFSAGSLPGSSITTKGPRGQPPCLASLLPASLLGSRHILSLNTNEIHLLLGAQLGSGSVFSSAQLGSVLQLSHSTTHLIIDRPGFPAHHLPQAQTVLSGLQGVVVCESSPSSRSLVGLGSAHNHVPQHTYSGHPSQVSVPSVRILFLPPGFTHVASPPESLP